VHLERDLEIADVLHPVADDLLDDGFLAGGDLEHELVVDLENHPCFETAGPELIPDPEHGDLDHVGGGALDGHVEGDPAARLLRGLVGLAKFRDLALPAENRLRISALLGLPDDPLEIIQDPGPLGEVAVDELLGFRR
jgi:hypothetical protein